jgi:iron-sulfur cluster assembly protein
MISISPSAAQEINRILALRDGDKLRLSLGKSDCEQFYYDLDAVSVVPVEDLVLTVAGLTLVVDRQYQHYLQDLEIDFAQDLMGGGFRFQNSAARKVCRCGSAFTARASDPDTLNAFEI